MTPLVYYDILLSVTDSVSEDSVIDVSVDTLVDFIEIPVSASGRARVYHVVVLVVQKLSQYCPYQNYWVHK